jgi:hypothetical protein
MYWPMSTERVWELGNSITAIYIERVQTPSRIYSARSWKDLKQGCIILNVTSYDGRSLGQYVYMDDMILKKISRTQEILDRPKVHLQWWSEGAQS